MQCLACRLSMRPALGIARLWKGLSTRCIGECEPCDFPFWHSIARRIKFTIADMRKTAESGANDGAGLGARLPQGDRRLCLTLNLSLRVILTT